MTEIEGRRGYKGIVSENTLLGFQTAVEPGAGGIALDLQMAKDRGIAVSHDEPLDWTNDGIESVKGLKLAENTKYSAAAIITDFPEKALLIGNAERTRMY
ncbi:MAG: glycerophosphodiester phosphodiesterase family protein [Bacillus sp. (in: firmicutes)]